MAADDDLRYIQPYEVKGGWRYRVTVRLSPTERPTRSFSDAEKARGFRNELLKERRRREEAAAKAASSFDVDLDGPRDQIPLIDFITGVWWPESAIGRLKDSTLQNYWLSFKKWAGDDSICDIPISEVRSHHITEWMDRAKKAGATDQAILTAMKPMAGAFKYAAARDYGLTSNPIRLVEWPSQGRKRTVHVFSPRIVEHVRRQILAGSSDDPQTDALYLTLMSQTGARPFTARAVKVEHLRPRHVYLGETKSGHSRMPPLWAPLRDEARALIKSRGLPTNAYLIRNVDGEGWSDEDFRSWRRYVFEPARDKVAEWLARKDEAKAEHLAEATPYHLCRHSYVALCLEAGWSLQRISRILDHRVDTLARHYANEIDEYADAKPIDPEAEVIKARRQREKLQPG